MKKTIKEKEDAKMSSKFIFKNFYENTNNDGVYYNRVLSVSEEEGVSIEEAELLLIEELDQLGGMSESDLADDFIESIDFSDLH